MKRTKDVRTFKPYYKWITFNTYYEYTVAAMLRDLLNLIINGLPSIPLPKG